MIGGNMIIELTFNNRQEGFILPVNPQTVEITEGSFNEKLKILNLGEINLLGKRGLIKTSLSSFFPSKNSPFNKDGREPSFYKEKIEKWKRSSKPIRVIITKLNLNLAMAIENFTTSTKEGSEDIEYTIELAEYIFLNVPSVKNKDDRKVTDNGLKERIKTQNHKTSYIVKAGESLWSIAKKTMGDGNKYVDLYNANKSLIDGKNKNIAKKYTIYPGQRLEIPI